MAIGLCILVSHDNTQSRSRLWDSSVTCVVESVYTELVELVMLDIALLKLSSKLPTLATKELKEELQSVEFMYLHALVDNCREYLICKKNSVHAFII